MAASLKKPVAGISFFTDQKRCPLAELFELNPIRTSPLHCDTYAAKVEFIIKCKLYFP